MTMTSLNSDGSVVLIGQDRPATEGMSTMRETVIRRARNGYEIVCGLVLAWFWLRSGIAHISNSYYFLSSVYSYEIVGPSFGLFVATVLPPFQMTLALSLLTRRFVAGAFLLSFVLLSVFIGVQTWALMRGMDIGCGCFGASEHKPIGSYSLALTTALWFCAGSALLCIVVSQRAKVAQSSA